MRLCITPVALWLAFISNGLTAEPCGIQVVDAQTKRGVPLVLLRTTSEQTFVTDSAGWVAIDEPDLLGRKVFFHVTSHGYEFPKDGFGSRGRAIELTPGGRTTLEIRRLNIAERLYRVTGAGIYADSVRLGQPVPLEQPLLAGGVAGQDSVQAAVFQGRVHWFWGDTNRLSYPLGQFRTSGAVSDLPSQGGLPPDVGVDFRYETNADGFSAPMFDLDGPGVVWLDGLCAVSDEAGAEHLVGHYSRREGLNRQLAHGLAEFDPRTRRFHSLIELPETESLHPQGQATRITDENGTAYIVFANPYPSLRVRAELQAIQDPMQYEGCTPLIPGRAADDDAPSIERNDQGQVVYTWKRHTAPLTANEEHQLIEKQLLPRHAARWQTTDAADGQRVLLHGGSVRWNAFRQRWVLIAVQTFGKPSFLGEVWYAESKQIEGPWSHAVRILTHDRYSFYNPTQHDFFDEEGGRFVYLEGTYTHTFANNPVPTPRYDYNQVMYRLDLTDPRLEGRGRQP